MAEPPPARSGRGSDSSLMALLPTLILAMFFGLLAYTTPKFFVETGDALHMAAHEGLAVGAVAISWELFYFHTC